LVTYFVQTPTENTTLKIIAIVAVAFAGATTVLLNTFRWGNRYGKASLAAISLQELASSTRLRFYDVFRTVRPEAIPEKLHLLNHESQKQMFEILRSVVQNEAAVFSNTPEELKHKAEKAESSLIEPYGTRKEQP
jgi:hypothetical protein